MNDLQEAALDAITKLCGGPEKIDGNDVRQIGHDHVMLDVAFTPVLPDRLPVDPAKQYLSYVPTPCRVQLDGLRYCVWLPDRLEKYRWVGDEELKVMRARYLLLRGWYFSIIETMPHSEQQEVIGKFFPGGVFKPTCLMEADAKAREAVK